MAVNYKIILIEKIQEGTYIPPCPFLWTPDPVEKAAFFIERSRSPHYFASLWSVSIRKTLICLVVFIASSARDQSLLHTAARQFRQLLESGSISTTRNEDRSGREKGEDPSPDYIMEKNLKGDSFRGCSFVLRSQCAAPRKRFLPHDQ